MKLATFDRGQGLETGIVTGERIVPTGESGTMIDLIARWDTVKAALAKRAAESDGVALSSVKLVAPVTRPGKVFAIGLNYADHIAESGLERPANQVWFTKAQTAINGPYDPILIPRNSKSVDYEVEFVAVIGKRGKYISEENARAHVFGYCVGNDVTERAWQFRTPQWSLGKSFDTHAPIGPWITTDDDIADPHALGLRCFVNGEQRQNSNTKHLVFNLWAQIAQLSQAMTLEPGDIIFTGTPGGVGMAMKPPVFLKAGDVVRCEIDGLGAIEAAMQAEA